MKANILNQFIALRASLENEKSEIENRLKQIRDVLEQPAASVAPVVARSEVKPVRRIKNPMPLREAVIQVTSQKPLSRSEIVEAVKGVGYRFQTKAPLNSLNMILYSKSSGFRRENGKFIPPRKLGAKEQTMPIAKRTMSRATRAKIRAAARKRWAKIK